MSSIFWGRGIQRESHAKTTTRPTQALIQQDILNYSQKETRENGEGKNTVSGREKFGRAKGRIIFTKHRKRYKGSYEYLFPTEEYMFPNSQRAQVQICGAARPRDPTARALAETQSQAKKIGSSQDKERVFPRLPLPDRGKTRKIDFAGRARGPICAATGPRDPTARVRFFSLTGKGEKKTCSARG